MRTRAFLLLAVIGVALVAVACGRASSQDIDQALGITPTATASAEQNAAATSAAATRSADAAANAGSPGAGGGEVAAVVGDVRRGSQQFRQVCSGCHRPNGPGGDILAAGSVGANVTVDSLRPMIREGTGHPNPPGPYPTSRVSDAAINDLVAYILSEAGAP